jgi:hypothetical protein
MREMHDALGVGARFARGVRRDGAPRRLRDVRENKTEDERASNRRRKDGAQFPNQNAQM